MVPLNWCTYIEHSPKSNCNWSFNASSSTNNIPSLNSLTYRSFNFNCTSRPLVSRQLCWVQQTIVHIGNVKQKVVERNNLIQNSTQFTTESAVDIGHKQLWKSLFLSKLNVLCTPQRILSHTYVIEPLQNGHRKQNRPYPVRTKNFKANFSSQNDWETSLRKFWTTNQKIGRFGKIFKSKFVKKDSL